jgi:hypothetical protein
MSTTQGIDARGALVGWVQGLTGMYVSDIRAIPEDKWTATFGGCTRPANEITADALGLIMFCTDSMKGNTPAGYMEQMQQLATEMSTKDAAIAKFQEVCGEFATTLEAATDETLNREIMPPWQMPTKLYSLAQMAASHIWYHDGQLNYIQCLLGDDKVHWMGD